MQGNAWNPESLDRGHSDDPRFEHDYQRSSDSKADLRPMKPQSLRHAGKERNQNLTPEPAVGSPFAKTLKQVVGAVFLEAAKAAAPPPDIGIVQWADARKQPALFRLLLHSLEYAISLGVCKQNLRVPTRKAMTLRILG